MVGRSAARVGESNAGCQSGDPNAHPGTEYWKWPRLNGSSARTDRRLADRTPPLRTSAFGFEDRRGTEC